MAISDSMKSIECKYVSILPTIKKCQNKIFCYKQEKIDIDNGNLLIRFTTQNLRLSLERKFPQESLKSNTISGKICSRETKFSVFDKAIRRICYS